MDETRVQAVLDAVTPERVRELVLRLEPQQPAVNRGRVPLWALYEPLSAGLPQRTGAEQADLEIRLREAIIAAIEQAEGMRFVEGDA